jgi:hypothetical protein
VTTYLALDKVTNSGLGHDGDGDGIHNLLDHLGVAHAGHATLRADVCWDTLEGHDGDSASLLCDAGLRLSERGVLMTLREKLTCSALTTSIMTPPFSMRASPALTAKLFSPSWALVPFVVGSSVAIVNVMWDDVM